MSEETKTPDHKKFLTQEERQKLISEVLGESLEDVSGKSGASEMSVAKAAAGFPVQRGTIALIRQYLAS